MALTMNAQMHNFFEAPSSATMSYDSLNAYAPPTLSNSLGFCDSPFMEGASEMPFNTSLTGDVPDDLMAMTPIHGWDTPPDSPVHVTSLFEGMVDPDLGMKVSSIFDEGQTNIPKHLQSSDNVFEWTPPASPSPETHEYASSSGYESNNEGFEGEESLSGGETNSWNAFDSFDTFEQIAKVGTKRKASSSAPVDESERRVIKHKAEMERIERTEACEEAVAALQDSKNDEDPESRRHTHNVLERKRRNDLKNSYQLLREQLPALEENDRAPTGQILLHAVEYITGMAEQEQDLEQKIHRAIVEGNRLRALRSSHTA